MIGFIVKDTIGIAAFNAGANAFYTWLMWRSWGQLTLLGSNAVGIDLSLTPLVIAFLSTLLGTAQLRKRLSAAGVGNFGPEAAIALMRYVPSNIFARAIAFGLLAGLLLGLPVFVPIYAHSDLTLSLSQAVVAKIVITIVDSSVIVPVVIGYSLLDVSRDV